MRPGRKPGPSFFNGLDLAAFFRVYLLLRRDLMKEPISMEPAQSVSGEARALAAKAKAAAKQAKDAKLLARLAKRRLKEARRDYKRARKTSRKARLEAKELAGRGFGGGAKGGGLETAQEQISKTRGSPEAGGSGWQIGLAETAPASGESGAEGWR